jgi:outer membrane scaffolding protein for murein synthesis (MipA/OmpV family)
VISINQELPFHKIVFSGIISASANYNLSKRWAVWIEPYYRQNINSILAKNSPMSQRLTAYGIKTGILYKF